MGVEYETTIIGDGNHASIEIPEWVLQKLGTNKRAPLIVTINGHSYQSTATGVGGACRVVFPAAHRAFAGAKAGDIVRVRLELDSGVRSVDLPMELVQALESAGLSEAFAALNYSKRKEFARQVADAKAAETKQRRIEAIVEQIKLR